MSQKLDGPRLAPASGNARQLVVFLHGYGADGNDLIGLGQMWQQLLPDTAFVSPNAPEPCPANPFGGRQWFPLTLRDTSELWTGALAAAPILNAFLDEELAIHGLDESALALVGFSQGTMMSLHVGLRRPKQLAAIVGYSGVLAGPEHLADDIRNKPPVLLIHGDQDELIPVAALPMTRDALDSVGVPVETHICKGLGHGIDETGLTLGAKFLAKAFQGAKVS